MVPLPKAFYSETAKYSFNSTTDQCWIIDSSTSHSLIPDKIFFTILNLLYEDIIVTVGNGDNLKALGTGTVYFEFSFGLRMSIEVLYIPGIQCFLISVSQLNHHIPLTFQDS